MKRKRKTRKPINHFEEQTIKMVNDAIRDLYIESLEEEINHLTGILKKGNKQKDNIPKYCFLCSWESSLVNIVPKGMTRDEYYKQLLTVCNHAKKWHKKTDGYKC